MDTDSIYDKMLTTLLKYLLLTQRFIVLLFLKLRYIGQKKVVAATNDPLLLMSATKLAEHIREGKVLSETVVLSYIKRIREVQPYINAMVEDRFGEAIEEAKVVDSLIALKYKTKEEIAKETPLLGVPFSVKLNFDVKGMIANAASEYFEHRRATTDAQAVSLLKNAGAIVLATTNIPEFCSVSYTSNRLYGRTNNPYDTIKSVSGSSGGEAALIASAGSVLGLGNEIGGGLRIPASFCGIFSHKPTCGVVPMDGVFPKFPPLLREMICSGPLCRYAEDLLTAMKILSGTKRAQMRLDEPVDITKLKVYYMQSDGDSDLVPQVDCDILLYQLKAATHFEDKLEAQLQNIELPEMKNIFFYCLGKYALSRCEKSMQEFVFGDENSISPLVELLKSLVGSSKFEVYNLLYAASDQTLLRKSLRQTPYIEKRFKALEETFARVLDERSVLLAPVFPLKASYHGEEAFLMHCSGYCAVFNVLGMPATFCPLGICESGLPFGIQIVASRGNDRLAIACAVELEKCFGGWKQPD